MTSVKHRLRMAAIHLCGHDRRALRRMLTEARLEMAQLWRFLEETSSK